MKQSIPYQSSPKLRGSGKRRAFTLIELMVVVTLISILSAILLSALAKARTRANAIFCLNNTRQLTQAWLLYAQDNNGRLVYNLSGSESRLASPMGDSYLNWVNNVMTWGLDSDNTNSATIKRAGLSPYAGDSVAIFHCPADNVLSPKQKSAGWSSRIRSYSMNAMVGDAGQLVQAGANIKNPGYRQFMAESSLAAVEASDIFVFLDEHPDSINDGNFANNGSKLQWESLPASYHNGAGSFSFADGHCVLHRWACQSTKRAARPDGAGLPFSILTSELTDYNWVVKHMSVNHP